MDGFVGRPSTARSGCADPNDPGCTARPRDADVMGYHTARDIPNYWAYAKQLRAAGPHVRAERVVEPARAPVHGVGVVGARARSRDDPIELPTRRIPPHLTTKPRPTVERPDPIYAWTDLTYLLHKHHVSWRYYVVERHRARLRGRRVVTAPPVRRTRRRPRSGTRCPYFDTVRDERPARQHPVGRPTSSRSRADGHAARGVWVVPPAAVSEHPPALGQRRPGLRHSLVNAVMQRPRLGLHRDLPRLGRLGRLLRPRRAAHGRRERLRAARARPS